MNKEGTSNPISIDEKLAGLAKTSKNQFIFRIDPVLRRENEEAYEPEKLSIGPYHHGKKKLQEMEKYKLKYTQRLLKRKGESSAQKYVSALMEVEEEARNYYAEQINFNREYFVEMMLLDGCFIIELLRKLDNPQEDDRDPSFLLLFESWCKDLLLFENQIPFFVLVILFDLSKIPGDDQEKDLIHLAISHLYPLIAADQPSESSYNVGSNDKIIHLLSLVYKSWCSSMDVKEEEYPNNSPEQKSCDFSVITFFQQFKSTSSKQDQEEGLLLLEAIKSVYELEGDGIEFKKASQSKSWLDIKFENGVIEIPGLMVENNTESLLRNLITYEQYMFDRGYSYCNFVTSYAIFMDCLINSSEDVRILRQRRIIKCWLSNDEEIAAMFNKICKNVMFLSPWFSYKKVFKDVNEYCGKRRNTWRAHLKKNYFNNPWSIISFFAATLLLLLTITQTVISILQLKL